MEISLELELWLLDQQLLQSSFTLVQIPIDMPAMPEKWGNWRSQDVCLPYNEWLVASRRQV